MTRRPWWPWRAPRCPRWPGIAPSASAGRFRTTSAWSGWCSVTRADGTVEERFHLDAPRQLSGGVPVSPGQLGIPAGETVKMRVVAYDNDHLEGSKRGESPEVEMKVVGPRGQGRMLTAHYRRLRDALLPSLAAFLTDPMLPAASPRGMTAWVGKARERLTPARELHGAGGRAQRPRRLWRRHGQQRQAVPSALKLEAAPTAG